MVKSLKSLTHSPFAVPLFLLVICGLAYGLLIPDLGFYWDDLPYALIYQRFGPGGYPDFVASDRPHSGWIFMGLTWLLGEQPLGYHIFGLLLYWLCAVLFWLLIRTIWPRFKKEALWAALFFAIYPGFLGQPKTIIYNHHFTAMALYLFSLIATVKAVQTPSQDKQAHAQWLWHIPAVLATSLSQFTIEYYIGWEAVRVMAVWIALGQQTSRHKHWLRNSLLHLAPYWLVTFGFLVWRTFIFRFPTYQPLGGGRAEITTLSWWWDILSQMVDAVFVVWGRALPQLSSQNYSQPFFLAYLFLTVLSIGLVFIFVHLYNTKLQNETQQRMQQIETAFGLPALLMALAGIGFAGWPFWLVNLQLDIWGYFYSRFTLAFIPWAALLLAALLHFLYSFRSQWLKVATTGLIALLVGGSIGWHFWNANFYRNQWIDIQRYFQQLVQRAPGLEPGTILLINDLQSLSLYQDDSLTALLNWTYSPENKTRQLDYAVFYLSVRLGRDFPALEPGLPIEKDFRSLTFSSSTDNFLVVYSQPPGCLRVLDPAQPDRVPLRLPDAMLEALPLSNLDLIQTETVPGAVPPAHLFDQEEYESWCLFFQMAELAAQRGDWARVAQIGDEAYAGKDQANELSEHFVFIDGYLRAGRLDTALALSKDVSERAFGELDEKICRIWQGASVETGPGSYYGEICPVN